MTDAWVRTTCNYGPPEYLHSPDCPVLDEEKRRRATMEELEELEECPHPTCGNTAEQPTEKDMGPLNALKEAAK